MHRIFARNGGGEAPVRVGAGFLLALALAYFLGGTETLCALILADAVHELGHLLALVLTGTELYALRLGGAGAVIECGGFSSRGAELVCLAAGPLGGLLFGLCAVGAGDFLRPAGTLSLLASGFNLLPALPLDGGRLLSALLSPRCGERTARILRITGSLTALLLALTAVLLRLYAGLAAAFYLAALVNFPQMR